MARLRGQKTDELVVLAFALAEGRDEVAAGVYDIHSPGIPKAAEISNLIKDPGTPAPPSVPTTKPQPDRTFLARPSGSGMVSHLRYKICALQYPLLSV
ncbi:hypothetical protein [Mesorhizobium captivum]|uniref:hypothetical protein n=1 Tax=Mesorhizobium captivum TaxID=3072319 RepID=UPI002A23B70D|nr:hypothetical protein [Mesorhizobium sp. VK23E]MDX8516469.1 hypothetical protein [Mesorhizobium sp. VK23E]